MKSRHFFQSLNKRSSNSRLAGRISRRTAVCRPSHIYSRAQTAPRLLGNDVTKQFDIDVGTNETPPRRQTNAQQGTNGFIWHSTTQELIPILPEDHPDYRQNAETIAAAIRRWNGGTSR